MKSGTFVSGLITFLILFSGSLARAGNITYSSINSPKAGTIRVYVTASCSNVTGNAVYINNVLKPVGKGGLVDATYAAPGGSDYVVVKFWNSSGSVCAQTSKTVSVAPVTSSGTVAGTYNCVYDGTLGHSVHTIKLSADGSYVQVSKDMAPYGGIVTTTCKKFSQDSINAAYACPSGNSLYLYGLWVNLNLLHGASSGFDMLNDTEYGPVQFYCTRQ